MKRICLSFFLFLVLFGITNCKKNNSGNSVSNSNKNLTYTDKKVYKEHNSMQLETNSLNLVDYDSVRKFFTLDYTPEYPDSVFNENQSKSKVSAEKTKTSSDKKSHSESYIPEIRKLSEYKTKYNTNKPIKQTVNNLDNSFEDDFEKSASLSQNLEIINLWGGYIKDSDCAYDWNRGALPPYENRFVVRVNTLTSLAAIKNNLTVTINEQTVECEIQPIYKDIFYMWANQAEYDEDSGLSNTWLFEIKSEIPHNTKVQIKNQKGETEEYYTLMPFTISYVSNMTEYSSAKYKWPLTIYFSQEPNLRSLVETITYDNGKQISDENISVNGCFVKIFNLPFDYNQTHTIRFGKLQDIYNQPLISEEELFSFKTPEEKSYVRFQNYGTTMLEAQFPHKMIFEHQNLLSGKYGLQKTDRPSGDGIYSFNKNSSNYFDLNLGEKNQRNFQELDLEPYLEDGYGFVRFEAVANYKQFNQWKNKYIDQESNMHGVVQVTDLGLTARMSMNKAVVMVRSLSTGKPVEGAEVFIVHNLNDNKDWQKNAYTPKEIFVYGNESTYDKLYAKGVTDKNGLAVIEYDKDCIELIQNENRDAFVYVVNGKDKAAFAPSSHNSWRDGVTTASLNRARTPEQRTFMFVDRGIYKPGETVTFRGIDRDQLLGTFTPHTGSYTLTAKGAWWDSKEIIEPIEGTLSESGGFFGSFKIPETLERGNYNLVYKRINPDNTDKNETAIIRFTVADFERVKFESSITVPDISYFGGDMLTATLSANYLAGGSLAGANYDVSWYKAATTFKTSDPAVRDYSFYTGVYPDRFYYSNAEGVLGVDGTASLHCESEKITDGTPYIYHIESAVTDISNQRISSSNDIFVHPAQFYVGIAQARNLSGFAKSGDTLEFPFILVTPDGKVMEEKDVQVKVSGLEYKLTHEVWTMVHEQSVDDTIYTRYERNDIEDACGSINVLANGIVQVTPKAAGWYTLKLTGKDSRGNKVICKKEFYVTGSGAIWFDQYNSYSLNLTPDKTQYNPGETARVLLESPLPAGDYLITVEREGIFTEEIRHFDNNAEVLEIPIAGNFVPVVYVSVSSYSERHGEPTHNYGEPDLDKPKGYYGVTPLLVNPYVRSFSVAIECDKPSYKPGDTATIKFKASKGGKPYAGAELTAMAVDRGVLDLINYHVPNPIDFFYNKEIFPLRVYGGDSRALLMDPVTYTVKNLTGGDFENDEKEEERKDFRPTAFFEPVLVTDKNGEATVSFKIPDSLTTYRITAFGVKDDLFALQEEEIKVQNPINFQQVQPRHLRERDTAECGLLITNLSKGGQKISVSLEVLSPTEDTEQDKLEGRKTVPGKGFVDGENTHTVFVASGQSSVVYFDVAAQNEGTINLVYTIKSDLVNERLISPIKIEKTFVYETVTLTGTLSKDNKDEIKENLIIPDFTKEGRGDLLFTLDATRLGILGSSVNYLFDYPYGCLEQQTSRILPLVSFDEYIDIFDLDSKVINIKECVKSWTKKWQDYQHADGGFGYWPESIDSSDFVSLRILYTYALAMTRGYSPEDIPINIDSLKSYIASAVKSYKTKYADSNYYDYDKAFACYVFSLLKDTSLESVQNELYTKIDELTLDASAYLSLTFANMGSSEDLKKAQSINKKICNYLEPSLRSLSISRKAKSGYWFWYQNENVQYAAILSALVTANPDDEMVDKLLFTLLSKQSHGRWQNTITTSSVLDSIYTYIQKRSLDSTDYTASLSLNNRQLMNESFKGLAAKPKTIKLPFEDEFISSLTKNESVPFEVKKEGDGSLFYTVEMKYALPDEAQAARSEGLNITYVITDFDTGEIINVTKDTCDLKLQSGKIYKAKVFIETNKTREYIAVRAPIPSGAEILDSTLVTSGQAAQSSYSDSWRSPLSHKNITDNEVQFFWDEMHSGKYFFDFTFRATRRGIYPTPPVQAECMYEPEVFGRSEGYLFIIE